MEITWNIKKHKFPSDRQESITLEGFINRVTVKNDVSNPEPDYLTPEPLIITSTYIQNSRYYEAFTLIYKQVYEKLVTFPDPVTEVKATTNVNYSEGSLTSGRYFTGIKAVYEDEQYFIFDVNSNTYSVLVSTTTDDFIFNTCSKGFYEYLYNDTGDLGTGDAFLNDEAQQKVYSYGGVASSNLVWGIAYWGDIGSTFIGSVNYLNSDYYLNTALTQTDLIINKTPAYSYSGNSGELLRVKNSYHNALIVGTNRITASYIPIVDNTLDFDNIIHIDTSYINAYYLTDIPENGAKNKYVSSTQQEYLEYEISPKLFFDRDYYTDNTVFITEISLKVV